MKDLCELYHGLCRIVTAGESPLCSNEGKVLVPSNRGKPVSEYRSIQMKLNPSMASFVDGDCKTREAELPCSSAARRIEQDISTVRSSNP